MKITRREFLKTAFWSAGGLLKPNFSHLRGLESDSPNVIVLVFDSLSARHLSLLGYPRNTTPNLQQFAEKATVYHRHYAAANFTSPATASLFTGMYPWTHRAIQQGGLIARELTEQNLFRLLDSSYQKAAFAQNIWADLFLHQFHDALDVHLKSTTFSIDENIHYNDEIWNTDALPSFRAFDDFLEQDYGLPGSLYFSLFDKVKGYLEQEYGRSEFKEEYPRGIPNFIKYKLHFILEDVFHGVAQEIIRLQNPFVGYFHFWTPHEPYFPNRRFIGMFDDNWSPVSKPAHSLGSGLPETELNQLRREYDEYLANLDAEFGKFHKRLEEEGVLENSYLIVTADHGQLFERGVHGHVTPLLYDPVIHIPLIISAPGQLARRDIYSPTSCVDLLPTILKITGSSQPEALEGNLLPGFGQDVVEKPVFAMEAKKNSSFMPLTSGTFAMMQGDFKLISYLGYAGHDDVYELYNIKTDPEELVDLNNSLPDVSRRMVEQWKQKLAESEGY